MSRSVTTYRISSAARRRRILHVLDRLGDAGLTSTSADDEHVVIDAATAAAHVKGRRIVLTLDPHATVETRLSAAADLWVDDPGDVVEWSRR